MQSTAVFPSRYQQRTCVCVGRGVTDASGIDGVLMTLEPLERAAGRGPAVARRRARRTLHERLHEFCLRLDSQARDEVRTEGPRQAPDQRADRLGLAQLLHEELLRVVFGARVARPKPGRELQLLLIRETGRGLAWLLHGAEGGREEGEEKEKSVQKKTTVGRKTF